MQDCVEIYQNNMKYYLFKLPYDVYEILSHSIYSQYFSLYFSEASPSPDANPKPDEISALNQILLNAAKYDYPKDVVFSYSSSVIIMTEIICVHMFEFLLIVTTPLSFYSNVIDVAQLDSQHMESQEYTERARQYGYTAKSLEQIEIYLDHQFLKHS